MLNERAINVQVDRPRIGARGSRVVRHRRVRDDNDAHARGVLAASVENHEALVLVLKPARMLVALIVARRRPCT